MKRKHPKTTPTRSTPPPSAIDVEAFRPYLTSGEFSALLTEMDQALPPAIRLNPLKTGHTFTTQLASKFGWKLEPIPFCASGFRVTIGDGPTVSNPLEHKLGLYYIQEAASMLPVELFSQLADEEICLDLAASPGGKTTHLVSRLQDRGLVIANDSSQGRIQALRIVLQNWGATCAAVTRFPGENFGAWYPEAFDRVLLDAPCSMQGLRTSESHAVRPVTEKESHQLAQRQFALLTSALQAARVGGEVVYSTCTLLPEEDEGVVASVLNRFNGQVLLLDAQVHLPTPAPGITNLGEYPGEDMARTIRLWPHRYHTAGFFACVLQKTSSLDLPTSPPPAHDMGKAGFFQLSASETRQFCGSFTETYGFELADYMEHNKRVLVRRAEKMFLFPLQLLTRFYGLPVQSAGMLLGEQMPDGFMPAHDWISRFGRDCQRNVVVLDQESAASWLSGENLDNSLSGVEITKYQVILNEDRLGLGCGKVTGKGLKNLLPRRLL